jgi:2-polyprenyl-3-methyl-5-hydroxy-6-metoxy-1,4-benzoquinol methylase
VSEYCLGIDILEHDIQMLKNDGFNVRVHDLCKESLDEKFDLIIMGEILEHVNDPYSLLLNASRSLEKEGEIILSTPNPWYISYLKEVSRQGFAVDNVDHIAWFDPATIYSLVDRADLKLISYHGLSSMTVNSTLGRVLAWLVNRISNLGLFPLSNSKSILYVIRK